MPSIPLKSFGTTGVKISALGLGGHHLGSAKDEKAAAEIVREALDGGITFFDNCWEYHRGKSENWMGRALRGQRDRIFLMLHFAVSKSACFPSPPKRGSLSLV